jgi:alpha-ribazole phosphatase
MVMRLLLVRHGITDWNAAGRFQGQADPGLNEIGQRQAAAIGERLSGETLASIYASDLRRAWQTAQAIAAFHDLDITPEPCLREVHFGEWEGLTYAEIQQRHSQELAAWQANLLRFAPPGGESLARLAARVEIALERIQRDQANQAERTILLVSHGGPLQALLCLALGLTPQKYWQFHLAPASLSKVSLYPEGAIVNLLNDTCHLEALETAGWDD